jgi:chloramphenicol-sensitive protein RarD
VVLLAVALAWLGRWRELVQCLRVRRTRWLLVASTLLIGSNWYAFIHGVNLGQVVQNSLGLFITPLLSVLLGVLFFRERLRPVQWLALGLAGAGLISLIAALGEWPWIALYLAGSFAAYGLIRKLLPMDTLTGLAAETLLLLPVSLAVLIWYACAGRLSLGSGGPGLDALIVASGAFTTVPLFCFGQSARRLPLSMLGFLQYLAPTLQFLMAVLVFEEPFELVQQVSFGLIWAALVLVSVQALLARRASGELIRTGRSAGAGTFRPGPAPSASVRAAGRR